ncbi:diguanylate cyclase domain-containing protein [Goekera deserti]|uniref:diguanylate cyclase domain-containing protein n=1 Tax=Goekera deserti TaxID=2497753 RepID=UPI001F243EB5|nr:diguanylate cyclase [Goekera deserti]
MLDTASVDVHSALVPPGALHDQVTAALTDGRLDDAEQLLGAVGDDPSPYAVEGSATEPPLDTLARAWSETLRAELLVRRLRLAGYTLLGDPTGPSAYGDPSHHDAGAGLDLHAGMTGLVEAGLASPLDPACGGDPPPTPPDDDDPDRTESATRAALAIALVRSARAAFDAQDDDLQRAAGLVRHARIELLSRRIDAAMDEAVEAASLLDPGLPPTVLLTHTLTALAGVLADLELMPLALDYQERAHEVALLLAGTPGELTRTETALLVGESAARWAGLSAEVGEELLDDGALDAAALHFTSARTLSARALEVLPAEGPATVAAQVVHGWALVGTGRYDEAGQLLTSAVARTTAEDAGLLASARLALGRALRRQGDVPGADEHLAAALELSTEHGLARLRRSSLRELCTLHAEQDDAARALPYLQAYLADELDRVDERRTRWVELFGRRKSLLETERAAGQLRRQAYEDPLTHLPNRRFAEARLDGLLGNGAAPALAVVDIDRFKSINDAAGHPGGDVVLRAVAQLLLDGCRDTDEVCRWAGDEFVILLPDTTAEQAERAMERIRRSIALHDWSALGIDVPVTISVGIASAARGDDRRTLFAAADGVLYDAKRGGRDRVVRLSGVTQTRATDHLMEPTPFAEPDWLPRPPAPAGLAVSDDPTTLNSDTSVAEIPSNGLTTISVDPVQASQLHDHPLFPRASVSRDDSGFGRLLVEPPGAEVPVIPAPPEPAVAETPPPRAPYEPIGPDVIWGTGRSTEQVLALVREARHTHPDRPAVVIRADAATLVALGAEHDAYTTMDAGAMAAAIGPLPEPAGRIGVLSASGADAPVAAEAAFVARVTGTTVVRVDDVGGNRIRSLITDRTLLDDLDCLVVVAGLDASLASVVSGLTDVPIVAVPTSTGNSGTFAGFGALLTMLNSANAGVVVSNIDSGHAAGVFAARIARRTARA